jgi:hypothetical protein
MDGLGSELQCAWHHEVLFHLCGHGRGNIGGCLMNIVDVVGNGHWCFFILVINKIVRLLG